MLRWYLIHTKSSGEAVAQVNLERQCYEVYLPRLVQTVLWRQRRRERVVPLFPRYLFLRLREGLQSLAPVRSSVGVSGIVRFGCRYATVPEETIGQLQSRADPQTGLHRLSRGCVLAPGSPVRIASGLLGGLDAVFEREAGSDRVLVLLTLLGQQARALLPAGLVLPAAAG